MIRCAKIGNQPGDSSLGYGMYALWRRIWAVGHPHRATIAEYLISATVASTIAIFPPLVLRWIIDDAIRIAA